MQPDPNPSGLCECGCGKPTGLARNTSRKRRSVKGRPSRFLPGHNRRSAPVDYALDPTTGCWVWQLHRHQSGYGMIRQRGRMVYAHRMVYERIVGPIPEGLQLDHLCRNRACVNPEHLQPVTQVENIRRGIRVKLSAEQVAAIRASSATQTALARIYGVSQAHVSRIQRGVRWSTKDTWVFEVGQHDGADRHRPAATAVALDEPGAVTDHPHAVSDGTDDAPPPRALDEDGLDEAA